MHNEFEKQVQQKLNELRLTPTPPVWEKVEAQIRTKKDRRRLFLLLPLLLALSGLLTWWWAGNRTNTPASTVAAPEVKTARPPAIAIPVPSITDAAIGQAAVSYTYTAPIYDRTARTEISIDRPEIGHRSGFEYRSAVNPSAPADTLHATDTAAQKTIKKDTSASSTPILAAKKHASKWQISISGGAAISGMQKPAGLAPQGTSDPALTNYTPRGPLLAPFVPPVTSARSFSIGLQARRALLPRLSIGTGIGYDYFSTKVLAGRQVVGGGSSQFLTNIFGTSVAYYNAPTEYEEHRYINSYHFISLPLLVDVQPLRRLPLVAEAALSLRQLVYTDALQYDAGDNALYPARDLHRTQFFSSLALVYRKGAWSGGPQFNYGLTAIEKKGGHLYSFGLKLNYLLKR